MTTNDAACERITLPGLAHCWLDFRPGSGGTVEIFDVHVAAECRRQGVGRKLLEALFRKLDPGARVWAITRADNEIALQWYEACQFSVSGVLRRFYGAQRGTDAVLLVRKAGGPV